MKNELSKIRLSQIASFSKSMALPPSHDEIEAMARALLAAHEQEPVVVDGIFKPGDAVGVFNIGNEFCPDHLVAWTVKGQNLPAGNYWLYIHQAPSMPDQSALADAIDAIVNDVLSVETIATTGAIKALFSMKTGEMRLAAAVAPSIPAAVPDVISITKARDKVINPANAEPFSQGWNACRAAMLKSGSLTNADTMQPIYEYYPDNGWSECNSKEHYEELTELWCRTRIVYVLTVNGNKNAQ